MTDAPNRSASTGSAPSAAAAEPDRPTLGRSAPVDTVPEPSPAARRLFGNQLPLAHRYATLLASEAVLRGLIGPREVPRLWDRHLVNSALLTDLLPPQARVVDVGSGAGLPGVPIAIRRPDLTLDLLEPMSRRTTFLDQAVEVLDLRGRVRIVRGRAGDADVATRLGAQDWLVARAVAPLERLVKWCLPLLRPGGTLLALKGASAQQEAVDFRFAARRVGVKLTVEQLGHGVLTEPTWVVIARRSGGIHA